MHISIKSIDVGFDLRAVGQTVLLDPETTSVAYDKPERGGYVTAADKHAEGTPQQILRTLRGAGYKCRFEELRAEKLEAHNAQEAAK